MRGVESLSSANKDKIVRENPHIAQVIANDHCYGYLLRAAETPPRVLHHGKAERAKYRRRRKEVKSVLHWGQRKLLLAEIEFLTRYGQSEASVVYAGAAPGTHIPILARMFPHLRFILVDPAPFRIRESRRRAPSPRLTPENIVIRQEQFTDDLAATLAGSECLFISDVRSGDFQTMNAEEAEEAVHCDMAAQMRWHMLMKPKWSLLKFRLPWKAGKTRYLAGEIFLPVWGPPTTTESRLLIKAGAEMRDYDNLAYQEEMFFFNTVTRVTLYPQQVEGLGLDQCYDCVVETRILHEYLSTAPSARQFCDAYNIEPSNEGVAQVSSLISLSLEGSRTLADGNLDPDYRLSNMLARKFLLQSRDRA